MLARLKACSGRVELLLDGDKDPRLNHIGPQQNCVPRNVGWFAFHCVVRTSCCPSRLSLTGGMATIPDVRGKGYGSDLLEACLHHMRAKNANLLWCSARVVALDFYKHLGLQTIGPEFEIEGIGPRYLMWMAVV